MKTTTPLQSHSTRIATPVTINRLGSVEEELTDRICREENGRRIFKYCRELSAILIRSYSENDGEVGELRDKLCASLTGSLNCSWKQADCLIELALDFVHAKVRGTYRRSNVDLSYLIATASGAVCDISSN